MWMKEILRMHVVNENLEKVDPRNECRAKEQGLPRERAGFSCAMSKGGKAGKAGRAADSADAQGPSALGRPGRFSRSDGDACFNSAVCLGAPFVASLVLPGYLADFAADGGLRACFGMGGPGGRTALETAPDLIRPKTTAPSRGTATVTPSPSR